MFTILTKIEIEQKPKTIIVIYNKIGYCNNKELSIYKWQEYFAIVVEIYFIIVLVFFESHIKNCDVGLMIFSQKAKFSNKACFFTNLR